MRAKAPKNQLVIDLDSIRIMASEGGKLVFTPKAEDAIIKLLQLQELIENQIKSVKEQIATAGQAIDPNFKGVVGENVKAIFRSYGEKYGYDNNFNTPAEVLKTVTWIKVNGAAVDAYIKEHGVMPIGIYAKDRDPQLSLTVVENNEIPFLPNAYGK